MIELMWFVINYFILPTILFSPFIWLIFTNIKRVRKDIKEGKTLWQAINSDNGYVGGYMPPKQDSSSSINRDWGYTSSDYATNPMFSCLSGNINYRR